MVCSVKRYNTKAFLWTANTFQNIQKCINLSKGKGGRGWRTLINVHTMCKLTNISLLPGLHQSQSGPWREANSCIQPSWGVQMSWSLNVKAAESVVVVFSNFLSALQLAVASILYTSPHERTYVTCDSKQEDWIKWAWAGGRGEKCLWPNTL